MDYRELFANRVRGLRDAAGLSIEDASERGELSPTFWGAVERGIQEPCLNSIFCFAKGLAVPTNVLVTFETNDAGSKDREQLNFLLDLFTPEQIQLVLRFSSLISKYKVERQP